MRNRDIIARLLRKNTSGARIVGFVLSNFLGLAIVLGGIQFYNDARSIWESEGSFVSSDYLVINKKVTSENTFNGKSGGFSASEISDIDAQTWVRKSAAFANADYRVWASLNQNGRGMSTSMFFESIPDEYVDVPKSQWSWQEGSDELPIIISKDYLTLYNFGFASAAGLPQMSEGLMSGIPLTLTLSNESGTEHITMHGRVAGYSNRLNTILVPRNFMEWSNARLGSPEETAPSRLIIDVNSPGDVAIAKYMENHDYEVAGDKSSSSASFMLRLVTGIIMAIGVVITLLSFFILLLSVSLLMEKNKDKLHTLLMLGYDARTVARPYVMIVVRASVAAFALATACMLMLRAYYLEPLRGLGADGANLLWSLVAGAVLTLLIILFNIMAVRRKVRASWRINAGI